VTAVSVTTGWLIVTKHLSGKTIPPHPEGAEGNGIFAVIGEMTAII
jgi:hypothetical protein